MAPGASDSALGDRHPDYPAVLGLCYTGGLAAWAESDPGGICEVYTGAACPGQFTNYNGTGVSAATLGPNFTAIRALSGENYPLATQNLTTTANGFLTNDFSPIGALTYPVPVYGTISVPIPESQNQYRISAKVTIALVRRTGLTSFTSTRPPFSKRNTRRATMSSGRTIFKTAEPKTRAKLEPAIRCRIMWC